MAANSGLCSCKNAKLQLILQQLTSTAQRVLRACPSSCVLAHLWLNSYHQPLLSAHTQGDTVQPLENIPTIQALTPTCGSRSHSVLYCWSVLLCSPVASPSKCVPIYPHKNPHHKSPLLCECIGWEGECAVQREHQ